MNENTKKKAINGIVAKIAHFERHLEANKKGLREAKQDHKTKQGRQHGSGIMALSFGYDETYTQKVLREYPAKIEKYETILKGYKEALEDLTNNY